MAECRICGEYFSVSRARRVLARRYGAGIYDEYCPDCDICEDCLEEDISADYATGQQLKELMGDSWDDD